MWRIFDFVEMVCELCLLSFPLCQDFKGGNQNSRDGNQSFKGAQQSSKVRIYPMFLFLCCPSVVFHVLMAGIPELCPFSDTSKTSWYKEGTLESCWKLCGVWNSYSGILYATCNFFLQTVSFCCYILVKLLIVWSDNLLFIALYGTLQGNTL